MSREVRFEPTTLCNYKCDICPREKLTRKLETMSFELFKTLIDKCDNYDICTFSGFGEPLMDKGLASKMNYAKSKGFKTMLLTNGSLMHSDRFDLLKEAGLDSVRFSLYGPPEHNPVKLHIQDAWARRGDVEIHLVTDNEAGWLGLDSVEVWKPHNWADGRSYRDVPGVQMKTCGRPLRGPLQIQVDGTVNMCCFDFNGQLTLGDLKTQSLSEIYKGAMFKRIWKAHLAGHYGGLICGCCDQRNADKADCLIYSTREEIARTQRLSMTGEII